MIIMIMTLGMTKKQIISFALSLSLYGVRLFLGIPSSHTRFFTRFDFERPQSAQVGIESPAGARRFFFFFFCILDIAKASLAFFLFFSNHFLFSWWFFNVIHKYNLCLMGLRVEQVGNFFLFVSSSFPSQKCQRSDPNEPK